jgi:transposase
VRVERATFPKATHVKRRFGVCGRVHARVDVSRRRDQVLCLMQDLRNTQESMAMGIEPEKAKPVLARPSSSFAACRDYFEAWTTATTL